MNRLAALFRLRQLRQVSISKHGSVLLLGLFLALNFLLRTVLLVFNFGNTDGRALTVLEIYSIGLLYDLLAAGFALLPYALYLMAVPQRWYRSRGHRYLTFALFFVVLSGLLFDLLAEWLFWDEFGVRFNFIAVDYLVYTNEVVGNIRESYNLPLLLSGLVAGAAALLWLLRKPLAQSLAYAHSHRQRLQHGLLLVGLAVISGFLVESTTFRISGNAYADELAHNGIYQLFAAFRNNQLDYATFYKSEPDEQAFGQLRKLLQAPNARFVSTDVHDVSRQVTYPEPERHYNVMYVTVESFSADFLSRFGNTQGITPHLDTILPQSLVFTNLYATGTRTIRGLEALSLSLPPTPGYSIVKRPHNEHLFSIGEVLQHRGYDSRFIYGGYGYFDNMNYFFGHNGFQVVDRADFDESEIHFANNWGVCDEDLFDKALQKADSSAAAGKPFFHFLMTTSNHRPFTYPDGRIDIPSHTGREGAVKYTDYAIARFLREARQHPWFANTIFVVIADHCAASAGRTSLPIDKYHIPCFVYAPGLVKPGEYRPLMSQIDVPPTVLGLLKLNYTSKFFGQDVLVQPKERVFIGSYQKVGYVQDHDLTVLVPKKGTESYELDEALVEEKPGPLHPQELENAISYYQTASYLFNHGGYRYQEQPVKPLAPASKRAQSAARPQK